MPEVIISQQQLDLASRLVVTTMMDMIHRGENVRQLDPLWEALSGWKPVTPMSIRQWKLQKELEAAIAARDEAKAGIKAYADRLKHTIRSTR